MTDQELLRRVLEEAIHRAAQDGIAWDSLLDGDKMNYLRLNPGKVNSSRYIPVCNNKYSNSVSYTP